MKTLRSSNDENKNQTPCGGIDNTIRLAKEIEDEAANWFMEFRIKLKNPSTFITLIVLSAFSLKSNVFLV